MWVDNVQLSETLGSALTIEGPHVHVYALSWAAQIQSKVRIPGHFHSTQDAVMGSTCCKTHPGLAELL